ncbi:hypothetical protein GCM10010402_68080 [Actinomadura luteofluorescens]
MPWDQAAAGPEGVGDSDRQVKAGQRAVLRPVVLPGFVRVGDVRHGCVGGCAEEADRDSDCVDAETGCRASHGDAQVVSRALRSEQQAEATSVFAEGRWRDVNRRFQKPLPRHERGHGTGT